MPHDGKDDKGQADDLRPIRETAVDGETFGEALSKAGFRPAKGERRIVSQGKRRQTLNKRAPKDAD